MRADEVPNSLLIQHLIYYATVVSQDWRSPTTAVLVVGLKTHIVVSLRCLKGDTTPTKSRWSLPWYNVCFGGTTTVDK